MGLSETSYMSLKVHTVYLCTRNSSPRAPSCEASGGSPIHAHYSALFDFWPARSTSFFARDLELKTIFKKVILILFRVLNLKQNLTDALCRSRYCFLKSSKSIRPSWSPSFSSHSLVIFGQRWSWWIDSSLLCFLLLAWFPLWKSQMPPQSLFMLMWLLLSIIGTTCLIFSWKKLSFQPLLRGAWALTMFT